MILSANRKAIMTSKFLGHQTWRRTILREKLVQVSGRASRLNRRIVGRERPAELYYFLPQNPGIYRLRKVLRTPDRSKRPQPILFQEILHTRVKAHLARFPHSPILPLPAHFLNRNNLAPREGIVNLVR